MIEQPVKTLMKMQVNQLEPVLLFDRNHSFWWVFVPRQDQILLRNIKVCQ